MSIIASVFAGAIVLIRTCVPLSLTILGGWIVRWMLFFFWGFAIVCQGRSELRHFIYALKVRWMELASYVAWVGILVLYQLMDCDKMSQAYYMGNMYGGMIPFYILGIYYSVTEASGRRMALAMGIVIGASCLQAIPTVWRDPSVVRQGAVISTSETRSLGIGAYDDLTGFAITLPFFIVIALQSKHIARTLGLTSCVATIALLMIATLSGVILLTGLAVGGVVVYYMLLGGIRFRRIALTSAASLVIGIAAMNFFPGIYEKAGIGRYYDKLTDTFTAIPGILSGREVDPTDRWGRMLESFGVFLKNPIGGLALGTASEGAIQIGGHSSLMDSLAYFGLLGGGPYVLFHLLVLWRLWKAWFHDRANALHWGCLLSCALYIFYSFFNVTTQGTTVGLFLYATAAGGQPTNISLDRSRTILGHSMRIR